MPPMNGTFDASTIAPEQGRGKHPVGKKFPAIVKGTSIEENSNKTGGFLQIVFETPVGQIFNNYNLWNPNQQAVEIAQKQLSALCHATGIFKLDWTNEGAALRGGQCMIDVDWQPGNEPTAEKPQGGYVQVSKIYDRNGNEPGKPPASAPQPQGQQWGAATTQQAPNGPAPQQPAQPMTQQPGGGWGAGQTNPNANSAPAWSQQTPNNNANATPNPPWGQK